MTHPSENTNESGAQSAPAPAPLPTPPSAGQSWKLKPAIVLLRTLRPHQWVKNTFIFSGLIFSVNLFRVDRLLATCLAFVVFCLASSGVYLVNDSRDAEEDRYHPKKKLRPIAAGLVSQRTALVLLFLCWFSAAALASFLPVIFRTIVLLYVLMNLAYSHGLKFTVIVDVMIIAVGFVFRAVAGAFAISQTPSPWLVLCTFMLALLVGFGKRRHELLQLGDAAASHRRSLAAYSLPFLDKMMGISGACAILTFSLYTMSDETLGRFGTRALVLTTPFVVYGVFRYFYLVYQQTEEGDPAKLFVTDLPTLINVVFWISSICFVIYGPRALKPWTVSDPAKWELHWRQ